MAPTSQVMEKFPVKPSVLSMRQASRAALMAAPIAGALFLSASAIANGTAKSNMSPRELEEARALDWVPLDELTDAQKKSVPSACCGAFVAPTRTDADVNLNPAEASLRASADNSQSEQQTQMTLQGKVNITQGNRSLRAENAHMNQDTRMAEMSGGIQLREPGLLVRADQAKMNLDTGDATLDHTRFVLYQSRVHGDAVHLHKFGDNIINLEQSKITSCEPGDNSWSIQGSQITLHPEEHYGTAENMRLNLKDVPVMYMPYMRFPVGNERLTGFLFPSIGYSSSLNELDVAAPFYWNIAPNYDAVITPRYISGRGSVLELDARHLSPHFESELNGSYIANDRGGYDPNPELNIEPDPPRNSERWFYNFKQKGGRGEAWSSSIDYSDISDNNFLRDMNYGSVDANRQAYLHQTAAISYRTDHWLTSAKADEFRLLTINQLPYRELPRINIDGNYRMDDWIFKLNNEYVSFTKNRYFETSTENVIYGDRVNTDYGVTWDKSSAWGFFRPGVAVKALAYELKDDNIQPDMSSSPSFVVPQATIDSGLYFDRNTSLFGASYLQTLEPRAFYFYSGYKNQDSLYNLTPGGSFVNFDTTELTFNYDQLFRTTRFAGGDRLDDANQLALAVSTAFISQANGTERVRLSLGQIFYGEDRRITIYDPKKAVSQDILEQNTRKTSDLAGQITGQVNRNLRITADAAYDQHEGRLDNANTGIHYQDEAYRIINLSYRYTLRPVSISPSQPVPVTNQPLNQIDASVVWPVVNNWSVILRSNYDFKYGVELDTFAGLEYDDCCYRVRVMGRRWLDFNYYNSNPDFLAHVTGKDYETGVLFELQLKGLASTSQRINSLLDRAVVGFTDREKNLR